MAHVSGCLYPVTTVKDYTEENKQKQTKVH